MPAVALRGLANFGSPLLLALLVHALERRERHQHFAAHLEVRRQLGLLSVLAGIVSGTAHGAHVGRDVLADRAVAARDAQRQPAAFEAQRQRHAVQLQLADVLDVRLAAQLVDAPLPVAQFLFVVGVVEREHRRGVRHLDEALARLAAHALRRRIGRDQLRMLGLELLQLVHQAVEFGVADLGIVEHVVAVLVVADLVAQRFDLLLHIFAGRHGAVVSSR